MFKQVKCGSCGNPFNKRGWRLSRVTRPISKTCYTDRSIHNLNLLRVNPNLLTRVVSVFDWWLVSLCNNLRCFFWGPGVKVPTLYIVLTLSLSVSSWRLVSRVVSLTRGLSFATSLTRQNHNCSSKKVMPSGLHSPQPQLNN